MVGIVIKKVDFIKCENFIKSSLNTLKFFNPFLILETVNPTVIAKAEAATEFLILCIPNKGILIFLINFFFIFGKIIFKSNSE